MGKARWKSVATTIAVTVGMPVFSSAVKFLGKWRTYPNKVFAFA